MEFTREFPPAPHSPFYCNDCGAEYFGTTQEAIDADWVMMSPHPVPDMLCPDCFDNLGTFESESATGYEAPEWSKNEDPTAT